MQRVADVPVRGNLQNRRAADAAMGDQHEVAESAAVAVRSDRQRDAAEVGQALLVLAGERERHQPGARRQHGVAELARKLVAEAGRTHARDRQTAGRDHQRRRAQLAHCGLHAKALVGALHVLHAASGVDAHTGVGAFVQQHLHDLLRRVVAEQLPELLLVIGDTVTLDHLDEMLRRVARQRRFAEMRIGGDEIGRSGAGIGEIAAAAAGHQDLLAAAVRVLDQADAAPALARDPRTHEACGAAADDDHIGRASICRAGIGRRGCGRGWRHRETSGSSCGRPL